MLFESSLFESWAVGAVMGVRQLSLAVAPASANAPSGSSGTGSTGGGVTQMTFFHPNGSGLPGINALHSLANGLGGWAMIFALVGLVIGAAVWALGAHSQNYHQSVAGRRAVLVSGAAALLVGAAPGIIGFFFNTGTSIHA